MVGRGGGGHCTGSEDEREKKCKARKAMTPLKHSADGPAKTEKGHWAVVNRCKLISGNNSKQSKGRKRGQIPKSN